MIDPVYWLFPLAGAGVGWIAGLFLPPYFFNAVLVSKWPAFARDLAHFTSTKLITKEDILLKLNKPGSYTKLLPVVEHHIDEFLRDRLKIAIPMIGMLIGERTISQLKTVFMSELEVIFPQVLSRYMSDLSEETDLQLELEKMLLKTNPVELFAFMRPVTRMMFAGFGVCIGLLAGIINSILFAILY